MSDEMTMGFLTGVPHKRGTNLNAAISDMHQASAMIEQQNEQLQSAWARIQMLEAETARLNDALAVKTAHAEGLAEMANAFIAQHPGSPLRADTGKRYQDGRNKLRMHLRYEAAFDACLSKLLGIANPASRRVD